MDLDITTLVVSIFQQNCRLVMDRKSREAVLIDPGDEDERILAAIEEKGARVTHILNTHGHIDHAGAVAPLQRALGVPFAMHGADVPFLGALPQRGAFWDMPDLEVPKLDLDLEGVASFPFAGEEIRILPTPGHTPGGLTFLFDDHGFFGDTLFRMSVGRTDLGGDAKVYARTLEDVVLALPDETIVHTGHGPDTSIGVERRENPFLNGQMRVDDGGSYL